MGFKVKVLSKEEKLQEALDIALAALQDYAETDKWTLQLCNCQSYCGCPNAYYNIFGDMFTNGFDIANDALLEIEQLLETGK